TLKWRGDETYFHWTDMSYFLDVWRTPDQTPPPAASDESLLEMMPMLVYRWHPQRSPLRTALIDASKLALRFWWVLAGLALASALPLLAHPTHYRLLAGWLYWLTLVAAGAVLGMPVDRYVIVVEPLLYILAAAGLGALLDIRTKREGP
ncbi:MAG: hypothetical protein H7Y32_05560, partial [Chloroflexales bacterium]|nr:hypothetical protein [Chloroflexales bacterium]